MAEEDKDVLGELDQIVENQAPKADRKAKPKKASSKEQEKNQMIVNVVDETISDGYIYSGAERQTQQAEAWRRYYRAPYGNEEEGYSEYVTDLLQTKVNQTRAFITEQYHRNVAPIVKFRPKNANDVEEAEAATEYVNDLFRNRCNGEHFIDQTIFNAALLKMCPVRIYMHKERKAEVVEFKFEGKPSELADKLAAFLVANEDATAEEPYEVIEDVMEDGKRIYACYKWKVENIVECYPKLEIISPENFFISRQAESLESAKVAAKISNQFLGDIKENFPNAHLLNGFNQKDAMSFWEELQSDYQTWYSETTWFAKWSYDSLQYFEQYDNQNDDSAGLGTKELFVVDAEIYLDLDNTGEKKLYQVIKAGNYLLHLEEISERSFLCGTLIPTGNKWIGLGLWDTMQYELREDTNLARAMTDAAAQAAHPNIAFDPGVYETDDVINRGPDTVIRVIEGAIPQQGVTPLEVIKLPGPDPTVQATLQHFRANTDDISGVGVGLQGASAEDISDTRLDKEAAGALQKQSTQLLNYYARNYANFLCDVQVKLLNTAIKGGATTSLLQIQDKWMEMDPKGWLPRSDYVLDVDVGVNDAAEKLKKAQGVMQTLGLLQGQPDPETGQTLGITAELLPTAGYEVGKMMLEAFGAKDMIPKILLEVPLKEDPQISALIESEVGKAVAGMQQQMQQMEQGLRDQIKLELQTEEKQAQIALEDRKVQLEERKQDHTEEEAAYKVAISDDAEDRREDESAYGSATEDRKLDIEERKVEADIRHKERELDLQELVESKAAESKATAVVSP